MVDFCYLWGTDNPGRSTSEHTAAEQPRNSEDRDLKEREFDIDGVFSLEVRDDPQLGSFVGCGPIPSFNDFPDKPQQNARNCTRDVFVDQGVRERFLICDL